MPFLVFGIRRPLRGLTILRAAFPGFRFAPPGAIFRRPLRGLILFTVDACAGFQQHGITPLPDSRTEEKGRREKGRRGEREIEV